MDSNGKQLLFKNEVYQIVACAIEVLNELGHGIVEKPYENALVVEFGLRAIPFRQQPVVDVLYKGNKVGLFVPGRDRVRRDRCRYKGHRQDNGSRTRLNVELLADYKVARRRNFKLQTP